MLDKKMFDIPTGSVFVSQAEIDEPDFGPQEFAKGILLLREEKGIEIDVQEISTGFYLRWWTPKDTIEVITVEEPPC